MSGRLTLNPLAHLEILGLIMIFFGPIGWARPVPVNPNHFRRPRLGMILTALAGPMSNLILALLCLALLNILFNSVGQFLGTLLYVGAYVNCNLCIFNLIPLPPLDGSRIVGNLLPPRQQLAYAKLEMYGPFILLLAFLLPPVQNDVFTPLFSWFHNLVFGVFGPIV
ncbi:site-2 protease family protein [Alicyclobacillus cycloheptanicus]|nr:site-2 protease family protein [Alicyclobacillus cycloheptanicus]